MKCILGTDYITTKEAAERYGYSRAWFEQKRHQHEEPKYVKLLGKGKVYYPLSETDKWFEENMKVI